MLSAIRRICSAASAGLFTVSSSAPVRTILRSAVADFSAGWAMDFSSATTAPAVGRDTGAASGRAMFSRRVLAYMCSKAGTPAALRVRSRLGMAMLAASRIIPLPITRGFQRLLPDFKGSVMADIACLLSRERVGYSSLQQICLRGVPRVRSRMLLLGAGHSKPSFARLDRRGRLSLRGSCHSVCDGGGEAGGGFGMIGEEEHGLDEFEFH